MTSGSGQYRFSVFSLDLQQRTLHRGSHKTALQDQAFRVLECLVRRHGEIVSREALSERISGGSPHFDSDQAINRAVNQIRWCLGDSPKAARYIETVPRMGYRFVAPVEFVPTVVPSSFLPIPPPPASPDDPRATVVALPAAEQPSQPAAAVGDVALQPQNGYVSKAIGLLILAVLVLVAAGAYWLHRRAAAERGTVRTASPASRVSLMVVPIHAPESLQEKADRLRYDLTDALGHVPEIRVPPTHLFQGTQNDASALREMLRDSKSDYILMGELRPDGAGCVFTAELVRAAELTHVANFRIEDPACQLPTLREKASYAVQHSLLGNGAKQDASQTGTSRAYEAFLEGEHELYMRTNESLERANEHFREAVTIDPEFADGYAGMANVYLILADRNGLPDGYSMAMQLARRAIAIKPSSALAHGVLGCATLSLNRDWAAALRELQLASELAPDDAVFHMWLSSFYSVSGESEKAVEQFKAARSADPFWPPVYQAGVLAYKNMEDYTNMLAAAEQLVKFAPDMKLAPEWMVAYQTKADALWLLQRYREAVLARQQAADISRDPALQKLEKTAALAFREGGPVAYAAALVRPYSDSRKLTEAHLDDAEWAVHANEPDLALRMLKVIASRRNSESINIPSDPVFHALRHSPAYLEIVRDIRK